MGGQLSEQGGTRLAKGADGGRVPPGHAKLADPSLAGRRDPAGVVDVLGGIKHAGQGSPIRTARDLVLGGARLGQRTLAGDANDGVENGVARRDPRASRCSVHATGKSAPARISNDPRAMLRW